MTRRPAAPGNMQGEARKETGTAYVDCHIAPSSLAGRGAPCSRIA
jgi:hypothetical protein